VTTNIRPDQLERRACSAGRPSPLLQVREHTASTTRPSDLVPRAHDLGWAREHRTVIDQAQGHSGASMTGRDGCQGRLAAVGRGPAGAGLSLAVSRRARACRDGSRRIALGALTETLVIDEAGGDAPGPDNDRLLLGCKGTRREAALHGRRGRLEGGQRKKAAARPHRFRPPAGLVCDPPGRILRDPEAAVQPAVRLVFDLWEQGGSALAVGTPVTPHPRRVPHRLWGQRHEGELVWEPWRHARVLAVLHHPASAGPSVDGRTKPRTRPRPGDAPRIKGRTWRGALADGPMVLPDVHPGSLTWAQGLRHQARLDANRPVRPEERRGAVREGAAPVPGSVVCGRCGRRLGVRDLDDGTPPSAACHQAHVDGAAPTCQSRRGDGVDAAVTPPLLAAMQPAPLAISMAPLAHRAAQARPMERQWPRQLERVRYEADLARRRLLAVDPENRRVARSLARDWHEKLAAVAPLEPDSAELPTRTARPLSPAERQRILALARDLPAVWHAPTTTDAERTQRLRFVVKDVTLTRRETTMAIAIRWQPQAGTTLEIPRPLRSCDARRTNPAVVDRLRARAPRQTDRHLALWRNQHRDTPGLGGAFTASRVQWIHWQDALPRRCPEHPLAHADRPRGAGQYSAWAAAERLNVAVGTIAAWCHAGRLAYLQEAPHHPRGITLTPEVIAAWRKPVRWRWSRYAWR
jgi:DNA invertase Pin-like site-specific DNA recombinase